MRTACHYLKCRFSSQKQRSGCCNPFGLVAGQPLWSKLVGRISFDEGDIDLIKLNIYEAAVADAELQLLDAKYKYFFYLAIYETARTGVAFGDAKPL
jgi:hypothetical protein